MNERLADMTWKDIPWADPSRPIPVAEGVQAVIPELDENGNKTGNYPVLAHDDYMRIMGDTAYKQSASLGDPEAILDRLRRSGPAPEDPPTVGVYLKPQVVEKVKK